MVAEKSPDAFRTISEAAETVGVPTHVLRFWESRFPQVSPVKRAGGRRYYRPADVELLAQIRRLLHDEGMTIRGVRRLLRQAGGKAKLLEAKTIADLTSADLEDEPADAPALVAATPLPAGADTPEVPDDEPVAEMAVEPMPDADEAPMAVDVEPEPEAPRILTFSRSAPALLPEPDEADEHVPEPALAEAESAAAPPAEIPDAPAGAPEPDAAGQADTAARRFRVRPDADWSRVTELVARLEALKSRAGGKS